MATTTLNVNKQTVLGLLSSGQESPFVIPEYQRPYSWGDDEITTLFDDLWNFSIERTESNDNAQNYFLGCVVSYKNNDERQIIDGQQRLTSLFLLLRAVFARLENEETKSDEVNNFISEISPALWKKDEMTGKVDKSHILLKSEVVSDSGNMILKRILETGQADSNATDNYSRNFNRFIALYKEKSETSPNHIFSFILALLKYTILLPIDADDQETALTIFNTLNNRGLPLSDADIFKSHIYKGLDEKGKKDFIDKWKKLEKESSDVNESIQSLFYYHMFYLRAKEGDSKTTTPGVRKFYLEKKTDRLTDGIIDTLTESLLLWKVVNGRQPIEKEVWSNNVDIRKILDCLSSYNNEFWKYPVSIFYMEHKSKEGFEEIFLKFLRKLYVMLLTRYLEIPTISAVKGDILKLNVDIIGNSHPAFFAGFEDKKTEGDEGRRAEHERTDNLLIMPHRNSVRMLLKLLAYENSNQTDLLPSYWEIEHIFPQTWDSKYYNLDKTEADKTLEHLGNKLPLEKKLNISASNGYFGKKKEKYRDSKIAVCKELGESAIEEWNLDNIRNRDVSLCKQIKSLFAQWISDYDAIKNAQNEPPVPTPEEQAMIELLRSKGLIK